MHTVLKVCAAISNPPRYQIYIKYRKCCTKILSPAIGVFIRLLNIYSYMFRPGSRHFYNTARLYSVWNLDPQWISVNLLVTQSFDTQQTDTDTDIHTTQNNEHRKKVLLYLLP